MDVTRESAREDQGITEISDLPDSLIDNILDCLPLGDAVRTSVLSRKWRHHWTRIGNLVIDQTFVYKEIGRPIQNSDLEKMRSKYTDAVGTILLLHNGSINKFVLYIPGCCEVPTIVAHVNKWMHYVSLNGVKDITIAFKTRFRTSLNSLASYIFQCRELRRLSLRNYNAHLPSYFTEFSNLVCLHMLNVHIDGGELDSLIAGCPLLEKLLLEDYCGPLRVSALRLKTLEAKDCHINGLTMENIPNLRTLSIRGLSSDVSLVQPHSLESFFDLMPTVENITLCAQCFDDHVVPLMLPTPLKCLRNLTLLALKAEDREMMPFALCILRSSPYLETFNFSLCNLHPSLDEDLEADVPFLEEVFSEPCCLNNLVTVKIKNVEGTWSQMALIKLILASCPALETLYLSAQCFLSNDEEFKLMTELIECSRASSKAKILYSNDLRNNSSVRYWNSSIDSSTFDFE